MKKDFDKRLSDHIKAVFNDAGSNDADAGWGLLREKYPVKNRRKPIKWLWWLAALILLSGFGAALWLVEKKDKDKSIKTIARAHNDSPEARKLPQRVNVKPANHSQLLAMPAIKNPTSSIVEKEQKGNAIMSSQLSAQKPGLHQSSKSKREPIIQTHKKVAALSQYENTSPTNHTTKINRAEEPVDNETDSNVNTGILQNGVSSFLIDKASWQLSGLTTYKPEPVKSDTSVPKTSLPKNKRMAYSIFASAFYSTAARSDNEFNWGTGGTVDFRLTNHIGFTSGLAMMRASLNYNMPAGSDNSPNTTVSTPGNPLAVLDFHNYMAKLLALDIPLNLKYSFAKPYNFISAGLSSTVYISERYDQVYTYLPAQAGLPDVHLVTQHHFDRADLFKTFNFSFGVGCPIGKQSTLIFEPFLKIPFAGLGTQQLKYDLTGVNLKLSFQ